MHRAISIVLIASLVSACTSSGSETSTTTSTSATAPTTPTATTPPAMQLRYGHAPGDVLEYEVSVNQDIAFTADGDAPSFGEDELPIDADLVTESSSMLSMSFADGPQGQTVEVTITGSFSGMRVAGTVDGETIDSLEEGGVEADLARIDPVDARWVLNERGEVLDGDQATPGIVGAELAALTGLTDDLLSTPLGPVFPVDRLLGVGDAWESTSVRRTSTGTIDARSTSEVTAVVDGVYEISTTTVTDGYETDLAEGFRELFLELEGLEPGDTLDADVQAQLDAIEFRVVVEESTSSSIVHFDPVSGVIVSATRTAGVELSMVFRFPSAPDGELSGYDLDLDLTQSASYTLVG